MPCWFIVCTALLARDSGFGSGMYHYNYEDKAMLVEGIIKILVFLFMSSEQ